MRKIVKAGMMCMAVLMLTAGCSKEAAETEEMTEVSTASDAEKETEEYIEGELKTLAEYKGVAVEIPEVPEITDEDVEAQIEQNLAMNPETIVITDRGAEDGDTVNIDYKGYKDGEAFQGGEASGYDLVLGSDTFIDGFEDGLIGAKAGDKKELNLTFPENYGQEDLAGAAVVFEVTVNEVKNQKEAVLNDDFVKRVSDVSTVDEYREYVRKDLEKLREISIENYTSNQIMRYLVENSDIICGSEELEAAYATQKANMESQMAMYGMSVETYLSMVGISQEEYEEQLNQAAEYAVKQEMILDEIIEREGIKADDDAREKVAYMYDETVESLTSVIGEHMMEDMAAMQNALEFLCENADVTIIESTEAAASSEESAADAESADAGAEPESSAGESQAQ